MKNTLEYRGYHGSVEFSAEDDVFFGIIIGINDHISYEGDSVKTLRKDFEESVDWYIDVCKEIGKEPEKMYKGSFNVRIDPALHKDLVIYSASQGKTLNATVEEAIVKYIK